jgi:hypothetical protein
MMATTTDTGVTIIITAMTITQGFIMVPEQVSPETIPAEIQTTFLLATNICLQKAAVSRVV